MTEDGKAVQDSISGRRPVDLLLAGAWFALVTGFVELAFLAIYKFGMGRWIHLGPHVLWMTPLMDLLLFIVPASAIALLAWRRPALVSLRLASFVFAFLGFLSLFFLFPWLYKTARLALAAGLGFQTARLVAKHREGFLFMVRRTTGGLILTVVLLAVGVNVWIWASEGLALSNLPPASSSAPNVLLIVLDTVRAQNLGLYGYSRPTSPNLERLAKKGTQFELALSTSPWTLPSHAAMFTGRFRHKLTADFFQPFGTKWPTLAEALSSNGYATAGFVANFDYCTYESGLNRGFSHYEDFTVTPEEFFYSASLGRYFATSRRLRRLLGHYDPLTYKRAEDVNRHFLSWLSKKPKRPFFAFLNYYDAHEPYLPAPPFDKEFGDVQKLKSALLYNGRGAGPSNKEKKTPEYRAMIGSAYDGAIAYMDHQIGLLVDELERKNVLDNTILVITADHGEHLGEHDLFGHSNSLFMTVIHVPLLISFPHTVPADRTVAEAVSLRDLAATIMDLANLREDSVFPGSSLRRHWEDGKNVSQPDTTPILSELNSDDGNPGWKGAKKSLIAEGKHYILYGDGHEELYDIAVDPREERNLAETQEGQEALGRLRSSVNQILARR